MSATFSSRHTKCISLSTSTTTSLNLCVDVSSLENLDSIPNLIIAGAAKSVEPQSMTQSRVEIHTVDAIPIIINSPKPGTFE